MSTPASHGDVRQVLNAVAQVRGKQEMLAEAQVRLDNKVTQVAATQDATRSELHDLHARFLDYVRKDELMQALQVAQNELQTIRQELETKYGHYADVRRQVTGVLQAMDAGVVTQRTIRDASEQLMIDTPRYWLAPALVALASWLRDDRVVAERALGEALRRDNDKTSLFFALVLRRNGRNAATARWLRQYVVRQDPSALSREFTVVLDAVATGVFGHEAQPLIHKHMHTWLALIGEDRSVVDAQVRRWRELIDGMRGPLDGSIVVLPEISPTWPQLVALYQGATVFGRAEAYLRGLMEGPLEQRPELGGRVDDILNTLVANYDQEEMPLRRQEAEKLAIIAHEGDKEAARKDSAEAAFDEKVDVLTLVTNAAFFPQQMGASQATRRWSVSLAKQWILDASGQLEAANRQSLPSAVELSLERWTGRIDGQSTERDLVNSLGQHIDTETQRAIDAVKFADGPLFAAVSAGVLMLIGVLVGLSAHSVGGFVFFLICALACGGWAAYKASELPARREELRRRGIQRRANAIAKLRGAIAETVDFRRAWQAELAKGAALRAYVSAFNSDSYVGIAPDQTGRG
jgi:hypothetical protein